MLREVTDGPWEPFVDALPPDAWERKAIAAILQPYVFSAAAE